MKAAIIAWIRSEQEQNNNLSGNAERHLNYLVHELVSVYASIFEKLGIPYVDSSRYHPMGVASSEQTL